MIINELLSYTSFYLDKSASENIRKILLSFYTADEILIAKKCLWENYKTNLQNFQDRKTTEKRTAKEANLDDIFKAFVTLDEVSVTTIFVSQNLDRLPRLNPEELNTTFLLERVTNLEKKLKEHEVTLTNHRVDILSLQDNINQKNSPLIGAEIRPKPSESPLNITNKPSGLYLDEKNSVDCQEGSGKISASSNKVKDLIDRFNSGTPNISNSKRKRRQSDSALICNTKHSSTKS